MVSPSVSHLQSLGSQPSLDGSEMAESEEGAAVTWAGVLATACLTPAPLQRRKRWHTIVRLPYFSGVSRRCSRSLNNRQSAVFESARAPSLRATQ